MDFTILPTVNATLNGLAAVLLGCGFAAIRRKNVALHKRCMIAAFATSILFLVSYLTYHTLRQMRHGVGHTHFPGSGAAAGMYYVLLISHVALAAIVPFLAVTLLRRAFRGDFAAHKRLARWAFPVWMYVSITGVLIYLMLYHWPTAARAPH